MSGVVACPTKWLFITFFIIWYEPSIITYRINKGYDYRRFKQVQTNKRIEVVRLKELF